jgi:hypothetical protein
MKRTSRDPKTGKLTTRYVDSGCKNNPAPSTERGRRREAKRQK